jgi:hypothetical protein
MEDVKGVPTLFADVDNIPHDKFVFCAQGRFPYRSVEIPDPTVPRISALSLLGNTPPYFKFPMFVPTLESDDTLCFAENPEGKGTLHFVGHFRAPAEALTEPTKAAMKFAHGFPQDYDPRDDYEGEDDGGFDDENSEGGESSGEDYSDLDDPGERQMMMGAEQGNEDDMAKLAELLQPMIESGIAKAMANLQPQTGITAQTPPAMVSSAPKGINFADEKISPREQALLDSINDLKMKFSEDHAKIEAYELAGAEEEAFQKFSAIADAECAKMKARAKRRSSPARFKFQPMAAEQAASAAGREVGRKEHPSRHVFRGIPQDVAGGSAGKIRRPSGRARPDGQRPIERRYGVRREGLSRSQPALQAAIRESEAGAEAARSGGR